MNRQFSGLFAALMIISATPGVAEDGMRILGSDEAPAVLNIVPWQERELGEAPDREMAPAGSVLDEALVPLDREQWLREQAYRTEWQNTESQSRPAAE